MTSHPKERRDRGFSIVETLIAISILVLAVTGPMAFAQQSLRAAAYARDQVAAFFLAQDAVEFVKHVRDENSLTGSRSEWLAGLAACREGDGCMLSSAEVNIGSDVDDSAFAVPCSDSGSEPPEDCRLYIDGESLLYVQPTGDPDATPSKFIRVVNIEPVDGMTEDDEVRIVVRVYWQTHPLLPERSIEVHENIMNWIQ